MNMHPRIKRYWKQALSFGFIWLIFSWVYVLLEYGILGRTEFYPSTGNKYDFWNARVVSTFGSFLTGFIQGWIEVSWLRSKFEKRPFWQKMLLKSAFYLILITVFLIVLALISNSYRYDKGFFDPQVLGSVKNFVFNFVFLSSMLYVALVIVVALFFSEAGQYLGIGEQYSFLSGKYHNANKERRIFMFLDMKSSTTIAERLGHARYFELLKTYYSDMTDAVLHTAGEIYQYVGDEIVISWKEREGLYQNNCLHCFRLIKESFQERASYYHEQFGLVPEFKAGMHIGEVTTGEIGILKKDIIHTGDVLNTAARVQAKCNEYNAKLLVTADLFEMLEKYEELRSRKLGSLKLRGKLKDVDLHEIITDSNQLED